VKWKPEELGQRVENFREVGRKIQGQRGIGPSVQEHPFEKSSGLVAEKFKK
jgi:hypothetical protein